MLIEMLVSSFAPVAIEGVKQGLAKLFGGVKPLSVDDQIKLDNADVERLKAVAALDNPGGTPSQWVVDLRASARYIAAWIVILGGIGIQFLVVDLTVKALMLEAVSVVFGFLFGTRIVANFTRK